MNHLKFQAKKYLNFSTSYLNSFRTENGQNFLNVAHQFVRENITYVVIRWIFAPKIQNFKHCKMRLFGEIFNHYNILNFMVDFKIPGLSSSAFWVIFITETIFWKIWLALIYRDEVEKDDCWQMTPYLHSLLPIRRLSLFISNIFSHIWTRHDWHASCQKCRWGGWQDGRHVMNTWKTHRIFEVLRENWFYKHNKTIFFLLP